MTPDVTTLRAVADLARIRQLQTEPDDAAALAYAQGVEDVLRYVVGDANQTPELRALLNAGEPS